MSNEKEAWSSDQIGWSTWEEKPKRKSYASVVKSNKLPVNQIEPPPMSPDSLMKQIFASFQESMDRSKLKISYKLNEISYKRNKSPNQDDKLVKTKDFFEKVHEATVKVEEIILLKKTPVTNFKNKNRRHKNKIHLQHKTMRQGYQFVKAY